jgi:hypothetical protein
MGMGFLEAAPLCDPSAPHKNVSFKLDLHKYFVLPLKNYPSFTLQSKYSKGKNKKKRERSSFKPDNSFRFLSVTSIAMIKLPHETSP